MRKIRNPRYAPEFLERKLSPTGLIYAPAAMVQMATIAPVSPAASTYDDSTVPFEDPTDPSNPSTPPTDTTGPTGPTS